MRERRLTKHQACPKVLLRYANAGRQLRIWRGRTQLATLGAKWDISITAHVLRIFWRTYTALSTFAQRIQVRSCYSPGERTQGGTWTHGTFGKLGRGAAAPLFSSCCMPAKVTAHYLQLLYAGKW
jgi:hypothetical protein